MIPFAYCLRKIAIAYQVFNRILEYVNNVRPQHADIPVTIIEQPTGAHSTIDEIENVEESEINKAEAPETKQTPRSNPEPLGE